MLSFSAASEPGEILAETLQWKVSQCVAVDFLGFVSVQMPKFLCIFGIAMLAAYTVAPRHSSLCCLPAVCLEIYVCLTAHSSAESSAIASLLALHRLPANKFAAHRYPRIFGIAMLAAYTVAPR